MNDHWQTVPGYFDFADLYDEIVDWAKPGATLVEVGTYRGKSLCYLGARVAASGKRLHVVGVDHFNGTPDEPWLQEMGMEAALRQNLELAGCADIVRVIPMASTVAAELFADNTLEFVFIDADHHGASVRADILAWLPKVMPGGILAGHDLRGDVLSVVEQMFRGFYEPCSRTSWRVRL